MNIFATLCFWFCVQLPSEVGVANMSAVTVMTGVLSTVVVFPAAVVTSFLFRLPKVKRSGDAAAEEEEEEGGIGFCKGDFDK